ncbi:MAG TPA: TlpA disulfide reductase family protein [Flavobacterium sp.]|nr:TlpA disulfide reductase family protein [Flavobacterium sp.]
MKKFSKMQFIFCSLLFLVFLIISGAFMGVIYKLFITLIIMSFCSWYLLLKSPFSKITSIAIIFLPVLLLYGGGYLYALLYHEDSYLGKPFFWGCLVITIFVYVSNKFTFSIIKAMSFLIPFCFLFTAYVYYTSTENKKEDIELTQLEKAQFIDESGNKHTLKTFKGKLTLFEFWTTSCSNCPKSLAQFHELAEQYKSNQNIDFRVVNINLGAKQNETTFSKLESTIKLKKLYASNLIFKQLNFKAAPAILVLDAQGKIAYFGFPNFKKLTQTYLPNIIEKELSKM